MGKLFLATSAIFTFLLYCGLNAYSVSAAELIDEFNAEELDTCIWDPRQADNPRLIQFGNERAGSDKKKFLMNLIDENRENEACPDRGDGKCQCQARAFSLLEHDSSDEDERLESLGASLIFSTPLQNRDTDSNCPRPEQRDGKNVVQRNELRFGMRRLHRHPIEEPHWYELLFRADGEIPTCGSTRWVTAQWKYDDSEWPYEGRFDPSPFLAQRFDNGVLHITVQNGQCRCMVAKAMGDPDDEGPAMLTAADLPPPRVSDLKPIEPLKCIWTGDKDGICEPDETFQVLALTTPTPPSLPDPTNSWVRMMYRIKASNEGEGEIDVYADRRFIVRVKGLIGYLGGKPDPVKFKFGHYRDKIPGGARLLFDRFCMSQSATTCDRGLSEIR